MLQLLARLIGVPTHNPGGDDLALARLLAGELRARHADEVTVHESPAWVLARWGRPRLLINAHLDTVPPNAGYSGDPFVARIEGGRVIGLGACDTKGAIAAILAALTEATPRDVAVLFSGDEECGSTAMHAFLDGGGAHGITQAIVCEPTSLRMGTRHRGIAVVQAQLDGPGGHSSRADELVAPVAELAHVAVAWQRWGMKRRELGPEGFVGMCMNVAELKGGVAFNVVPSSATVSASVRPPPGSDVAALAHELMDLAALTVPGAALRAPVVNPSFQTRAPADFARWLGTAAATDLGFWTEAALLSGAGIDAVAFGPGDIAQAHAPDEFVEVAELERARVAFVRLFRASAA